MSRRHRWIWIDAGALPAGLTIIVVALTAHSHHKSSDPAGVFRSYTLVQVAGPAILLVVGVPALVALLLVPVLHLKTRRRSHLASRLAWLLATVSCGVCLAGLLIEGVVMLPAAALTVAAVAATPLPPLPR